jgi:hypothetical protein
MVVLVAAVRVGRDARPSPGSLERDDEAANIADIPP